MQNGNFEMLDFLFIVSFIVQMQNASELSKQATNNEVINDIHAHIVRLDEKLDQILKLLDN